MAALSRRKALAAGAAMGLAGAPALAAPQPDAKLLALGAEWDAKEKAVRAIYERHCHEAPIAYAPGEEADLRRLVARSHALRHAIAGIPARTAEGVRVKARVLMDMVAPDGAPPHYDADQMVCWSLCRDLLRA